MDPSTVFKTSSTDLCNPLFVFVDSFLLPSITGSAFPILQSHLSVKSFDARVVSFTIVYSSNYLLREAAKEELC